MGLEDAGGNDSLNHSNDTTIEELINIYGREPVRRGLEYITSLSEAEEEYTSNADGKDLEDGLKEAGVQDDESISRAADEWEQRMKDNGLGLEE